MPDTSRYQRADHEQAAAGLKVAAEAFHEDLDRHLTWLEHRGPDAYRVASINGVVAGMLHILDDAQRFGGSEVRTWAIDNVATTPHLRNRGVAKTLMLGMMREAREAGVPLSTLYASTPTFYRKIGYEPAGWIYHWAYDAEVFPAPRTGVSVRPYAPDMRQTIKSIYAQCHAEGQGVLVRRDDTFWDWRLSNPFRPHFAHGYLLEFDGTAEAYAVVAHSRQRGGVSVHDCAAMSLRGWQSLAAFFHGYNSVNQNIHWYGAPADPLRLLIPENPGCEDCEEWLMRIINPDAALEQRGYPKVHCELHLDVADQSLPENTGKRVLTVRDGMPTVQPGGSGRIPLDIRALAAIYTGHATPAEMKAVGLLDGPPEDLAAMQLAFAGPRPYLVDHY